MGSSTGGSEGSTSGVVLGGPWGAVGGSGRTGAEGVGVTAATTRSVESGRSPDGARGASRTVGATELGAGAARLCAGGRNGVHGGVG